MLQQVSGEEGKIYEFNTIHLIIAMNNKSSIFAHYILAFVPSGVHELQVMNLFLKYKKVQLLMI